MTPRYWQLTADGRVECQLCPRHCRLRDGQRGFCFVRQNQGGRLELTTYGQASSLCLDPIEKKPLNHVAPGSTVLSFGTPGCNLGCQYCQNWTLSTARDWDAHSQSASPAMIAQAAVDQHCRGVAYTYNDPVIFAEYAIDVAAACREQGLINVAVTAGYIDPGPRVDFFSAMDAVNLDLKSFDPAFYRRLVGGRLEVVLDTATYLVHDTTVWVELTTLLIPGYNDSETEIRELTEWIANALGPDVPWHVTAFHPDHRMRQVPPTAPAALRRARQWGLAAGLRYVYTGNIRDLAGATTVCPGCGAEIVVRDGYAIRRYALTSAGCCPNCGQFIPGRW